MSSLLMLIDGHALIYRSFHAFPELSDPQGRLVNAVYGFSRILLTSIRDFEPSHIAVTFDHPQPTFRHVQYQAYKAQREKMPDTLIPQISIIKEVVTALNIPQYELAGYEADDLIGTLTHQAEQQAHSSLIVTGDKDALQLVTDLTHVFTPKRGKFGENTEYDPAGVVRKMGVRPDQIIDLKALMGDSSDNIPGVTGIGQKTATTLIQTYGSLERIYQAVAENDSRLKPGVKQKLSAGHDQAILSQQLATISRDVPIQLSLEACRVAGYDKQRITALFDQLEFTSLSKLLPADDFELGLQEALF